MGANLREQIFAFLRDPSKMQFRYKYGCWGRTLIRCPYDDETDFLYLTGAYGDQIPMERGNDASYAGIYSKILDDVIDPSYHLMDVIGRSEGHSADSITHAIEEKATSIAISIIGEKSVEVTDEAENLREDEEYFLKYQLQDEAERCFFERRTPSFSVNVRVNNLTTTEFVQAVNHPDVLARAQAEAFVRRYAKHINKSLWEIPLIEARLAEIEASNGELHVRRAIAESIHSEKMVRVEIERDGKRMTIKMEAGHLRNTRNNRYNAWYMDAQSRAAYECEFGRMSDLLPQEIIRILYGKKILYQNDN